MYTYTCKMCGGTITAEEGKGVAVCEYCGMHQTLPKSEDEGVITLFDRANNLRRKNFEFDEAHRCYEQLVGKGTKDPEAYWGLVLCKYGIEYVEDKATGTYIPTCHRTQVESVLTDVDYQFALEYADDAQRKVYEYEAKRIDQIQKNILTIASEEEPYDVFICYKETDDETKERTRDSVDAEEIYYRLTNEGFKVFYSNITLEGKLGYQYEPCIFAALNSAKVMLVIGTKLEYFTAPWVKNEWSRFLKIVAKDKNRRKKLFPCYRDIDPYHLPADFTHLQALNMNKIGFIEDIIRGIKKLIPKEEPKPVEKVIIQQTEAPAGNNPSVLSLLNRANLFLEDGDFENANAYADRILDIDAYNGEAYIIKLLVDYKCKKENQLANLQESFEKNVNYVKAVRYCTAEGVKNLKEYIVAYYRNMQARILRLVEQSSSKEALKKSLNAVAEFKKTTGDIAELKGKLDIVSPLQNVLQGKMDDIATRTEKTLTAEEYQKVLGDMVALKKHLVAALPELENKIDMLSKLEFATHKAFETIFDWEQVVKIKEHFEAFAKTEDVVNHKKTITRMQAFSFGIIYDLAVEYSNYRKDIQKISNAYEAFLYLEDFRDSAERAEACLIRVKECRQANDYEEAKKLYNGGRYEEACNLLKPLARENYKDAKELLEKATQEILRIERAVAACIRRENIWLTITNILFYAIAILGAWVLFSNYGPQLWKVMTSDNDDVVSSIWSFQYLEIAVPFAVYFFIINLMSGVVGANEKGTAFARALVVDIIVLGACLIFFLIGGFSTGTWSSGFIVKIIEFGVYLIICVALFIERLIIAIVAGGIGIAITSDETGLGDYLHDVPVWRIVLMVVLVIASAVLCLCTAGIIVL